MDKKYKPSELAEMLNVSVRTLQRWDNEGVLKAYRTPTDRRYYTHSQYLGYIGVSSEEEKRSRNIIYSRVSSQWQKDDLVNHTEFLRQFANARGIIIDEVIEEVASGMNYNRKKWNDLLDRVQKNEIKSILISHKDRFIRFGFEWFERFLKAHGTDITVVNNEKLSPQLEMVQDLISIIHAFSCRIYGLRKYKNQIKGDSDLC